MGQAVLPWGCAMSLPTMEAERVRRAAALILSAVNVHASAATRPQRLTPEQFEYLRILNSELAEGIRGLDVPLPGPYGGEHIRFLRPSNLGYCRARSSSDGVIYLVSVTRQWLSEMKVLAGEGRVGGTNSQQRPKRSTERGEAQLKVVAALTKHHRYAEEGCLNEEPIGVNRLARMARVAPSTVSKFFSTKFKGHSRYRGLCRQPKELLDCLKVLRGEFLPHELLYGRRPPGEEDRSRSSDD